MNPAITSLRRRLGAVILCLLLALPGALAAAELRVAVASNFRLAMNELTTRFEAASGHRVNLSFGSTGKHYAQIVHGAPFDAFFAADAERPLRLEREGRIVPGSRFTYAVGRLIFLNGVGAIAGPLVMGWLMSRIGPPGFFVVLAVLLAALAAYAAWRMTRRAPPSADMTGPYVPVLPQASPVTVEAVGDVQGAAVDPAAAARAAE